MGKTKSKETNSTAEVTTLKEKVKLYNNQKCLWIVPPKLIGFKGFSDKCLVDPLFSIEVEKDAFDSYYKSSKPFQYLIDKGLVVVVKASKHVNLDKRDLMSVEAAEAPPHLTGKGNTKNLEISTQPVKLEIKKQG